MSLRVGAGLALNAVTRAYQSLKEEVDRDCLTSFLMIPASAREIVWQKMFGILLVALMMFTWLTPIWLFFWFFGAVSLVGILTVLVAFICFMLPVLGLGLLTGMNVKSPIVAIIVLVAMSKLVETGFFSIFSPVPEIAVQFLVPLRALRQSYLDGGAGLWDPLPKLKVLGAATVYGLAGLAVLEYAVRGFSKFTGRIE